ncbi:MAG: hypothetical protein ACLP5V_10655 [Candidatus Bathyarchaeia archaeon]
MSLRNTFHAGIIVHRDFKSLKGVPAGCDNRTLIDVVDVNTFSQHSPTPSEHEQDNEITQRGPNATGRDRNETGHEETTPDFHPTLSQKTNGSNASRFIAGDAPVFLGKYD